MVVLLDSKNLKKQIKRELNFGLDKYITYKKFATKTVISKNKLLKIFNNIRNKKKIIIGYGATAKAATVLNFCNIDNDIISYFLDTTPDKQNKLMPGRNIKILKYKKDILKRYDYVFLGAWNFKFSFFFKYFVLKIPCS